MVAIGASLMVTMGCVPVPPASQAEEDVPAQGRGTCNAGAAQTLVGREASSEIGAEVLRLTGATALRWIRPGDVVTMDYREDRVNLDLDSSNRVRAVRCG